jgi:hypothetical protein
MVRTTHKQNLLYPANVFLAVLFFALFACYALRLVQATGTLSVLTIKTGSFPGYILSGNHQCNDWGHSMLGESHQVVVLSAAGLDSQPTLVARPGVEKHFSCNTPVTNREPGTRFI